MLLPFTHVARSTLLLHAPHAPLAAGATARGSSDEPFWRSLALPPYGMQA
jgi:hypothetical protein